MLLRLRLGGENRSTRSRQAEWKRGWEGEGHFSATDCHTVYGLFMNKLCVSLGHCCGPVTMASMVRGRRNVALLGNRDAEGGRNGGGRSGEGSLLRTTLITGHISTFQPEDTPCHFLLLHTLLSLSPRPLLSSLPVLSLSTNPSLQLTPSASSSDRVTVPPSSPAHFPL